MSKEEHQKLADQVGQRAASIATQQSKSERRLDKLDDQVSGVYAKLSQDQVAAGLSIIKAQASNFAKNCHALLPILDTLSGAHPAISAAVAIIKIGVKLELDRRENDDRVVALYSTMMDMMGILKSLENVLTQQASEADRQAVEGRLEKRFDGENGIVATVKLCFRTCDSYYKRRLPVKILTSGKWKETFKDLAQQFEAHKEGLQLDLQIHAAQTLANISTTLDMIFDRLGGPQERELVAFVNSNGGERQVAQNETLMRELLKQSKPAEDQKTSSQLTVGELQKQINKDIKLVLSEDFRAFERKFEMMSAQIKDQVDSAVRGGTERVLKALEAGRAGPHERIEDDDVYHVWTENRWWGSVKATRLVLALHDHFSHRIQASGLVGLADKNAASPTSPTVPPSNDTREDTKQDINTSAADEWALQYINLFRVRELVEIIDDDVSSFITVDEVNAFTSAKPPGWSLPHWIAYSTVGIELATSWYYLRIIRLLHQIDLDRQNALPANRAALNAFVESTGLRFVALLLSGIAVSEIQDEIDWENDTLFCRFKDHILEQEQKMREVLHSISYCIDDESALKMLTGGRQPEKYILALVCVLIQRATLVVQAAQHIVLDNYELRLFEISFRTILQASAHRVRALRTSYRLQNLDPEDHVRRFFRGMYANLLTGDMPNCDFLSRDVTEQAFKEDASYYGHDDSPTSIQLYYGVSAEDTDFFPSPSAVNAALSHVDSTLIAGHWTGGISYGSSTEVSDSERSDVDLLIDLYEGTSFRGKGKDPQGNFTVQGRLEGSRVIMFQFYPSDCRSYIGDLLDAEDETRFVGTWGGCGWGGKFDLRKKKHRTAEETTDARNLEEAGALPVQRSPTLVGHWWGSYRVGSDPAAPTDGLVSLDITRHLPDGTIQGEGLDAVGLFSIRGRTEGVLITMRKEYEAGFGWDYKGSADDTGDEITGTWGDDDASNAESPQGTFSLTRRPEDYFLFRPQQLDSASCPGKARMLWQWAIATIIYRASRDKRIFLSHLDLRSKYKERFTGFLLQRDAPGDLDEGSLSLWRDAVSVITRHDIHFWHRRDLFVGRRQIYHSTITCDSCDRDPLIGSRLMCIECSFSESGDFSVDFCLDCFTTGQDRQFTGKHNHRPSHHLLLSRTVHDLRGLHATHQLAKAAIAEVQSNKGAPSLTPPERIFDPSGEAGSKERCSGVDQGVADETGVEDIGAAEILVATSQIHEGFVCVSCQQNVVAPFWKCLYCSSTIICNTCNAKVERRRPWLYEHQIAQYDDPEGLHAWDHALLLVPAISDEDENISAEISAMETRLTNLEDKLTAHFESSSETYSNLVAMQQDQMARIARLEIQQEAADQRMTRVEELLLRLVEGMGRSSNQ